MKNKGKMILVGSAVFVALLIVGVVLWNIVSKQNMGENKEARRTFPKEEMIDIVYVGNSLLEVPGIPDKVEKCAEACGYTLKSHSYFLSGGTLKKSLERVEMLDNMRENIQNADVLVLQEYGNNYETTYEDILAFVALCSDDTEVYYYMTEFDFDESLLEKIANDERVHLISASELTMQATILCGYDYEKDMLKPGDYHPSQTYAHLCGVFTFSTIVGQKCIDYPISEEDDIFEYLKGADASEKMECFRTLYECADLIIEQHEGMLKTNR